MKFKKKEHLYHALTILALFILYAVIYIPHAFALCILFVLVMEIYLIICSLIQTIFENVKKK